MKKTKNLEGLVYSMPGRQSQKHLQNVLDITLWCYTLIQFIYIKRISGEKNQLWLFHPDYNWFYQQTNGLIYILKTIYIFIII